MVLENVEEVQMRMGEERLSDVSVVARVAVVYYSLSQQTRRLVDSYVEGLRNAGIKVDSIALHPLHSIKLPIRTNFHLFRAMWLPFWRTRQEIEPIDFRGEEYDYVVLAGPTWSYQPSGPMLSFFDHYGPMLTSKRVGFLISCRSYWRTHLWALKRLCGRYGAYPEKAIVFEHATTEPWCTIGLLLWLRGVSYNSLPGWFQKRYPNYGHSNNQVVRAYEEAKALAHRLMKGFD